MFSIIKRVLILAGKFAGKIKLAMGISFFEALFNNIPFFMIFYIVSEILQDSLDRADLRFAMIMIITALLVQVILKRIIYSLQSGSGFEIFARERIAIGDRLKRYPMGYFSEGNLGYISAVITSDINFVEMYVMNIVDRVVIAYVNAVIAVLFLLYIDYRLALISAVVYLLANLSLNKLFAVGKLQGQTRQNTQSEVVTAVLEYVRGMSVIKSFNLTGPKAKATKKAFEKFRDISIAMEKAFVPLIFRFESWFAFGIALTVLVASLAVKSGSMLLPELLIVLIFIFRIYIPFQALSGQSAEIRLMEACLDRYQKLKDIEIIDQAGQDKQLKNYQIEFEDVSFAYEEHDVLHDLTFQIPEHSMTALVGSSGSGKSTIANLIARFWDVEQGQVKVGGINVKELTCDSLLQNISMVFQNVYLFNDTILNNIRFGNPQATEAEVIAAAKKARCHHFIQQLEAGYQTVVEEGGSSLSGGEKQRISIARAILKDAPIILLDEATASVDPENEKYIQQAINELVKDKTLIVIAHRLSTIKNADQILVLEAGRLIQQGKHSELIKEAGKYQDFWQKRMNAKSWQISHV
jgi:ATP-binding cassette subfamily B protein